MPIGHDRSVVTEGWEPEAENWIGWERESNHDAYHLYRDHFFELVPGAGESTLEIGCGEGRVARALVARRRCVTGIDPRLRLFGRTRGYGMLPHMSDALDADGCCLGSR